MDGPAVRRKGEDSEVIDPAADLANPENWRSSSEYGGTPGSSGQGPAYLHFDQ